LEAFQSYTGYLIIRDYVDNFSYMGQKNVEPFERQAMPEHPENPRRSGE
jgi:hypothetical protein